MHALKEMWKPIFDDQELEVMKMIPAEKFNKPEPPADSEFLRLLRISEFFCFI